MLTLSACSGGSSETSTQSSTTPATTTTAIAANTQRPEGRWTVVSWVTKRSDIENAPKQASAKQWKIEPKCSTGPCDLAVSPDGTDGSYRPAGYAALSAKDDTKDPFVLAWDAKSGTYSYTSQPEASTCTVAGGKVIADGYEVVKRVTYRFVPGTDGSAPALRGTSTQTAHGVGPGVGAGCTDFTQNSTSVGALTAEGPSSDDVDLSGTYTVSEIIESTSSTTEVPGTSALVSSAATIAASGKGYTLKSADKPATLSRTPKGWAGSTPAMMSDCTFSDHAITDGYSSTVTVTDLHPVATDDAGNPVLVGHWLWQSTPSAQAAAERCVPGQDKGFVIFVPND